MDMSQRQASQEYGRFIHRAAVRVGSSTRLGGRVGFGKKEIQAIKAGRALDYDRESLTKLAQSIEGELGRRTSEYLCQLVLTMKS